MAQSSPAWLGYSMNRPDWLWLPAGYLEKNYLPPIFKQFLKIFREVLVLDRHFAISLIKRHIKLGITKLLKAGPL